MAIYHLTAKTVSRGESASAAARSDYIERAGRYHSDEVEVLHKGHGNMPAWAEDCPGTYWQAADLYERANGRLFKQLEFALPRELSPEERSQLISEFAPLIKYIASRIAMRLPPHIDINDLINAGVIGLIDAI